VGRWLGYDGENRDDYFEFTFWGLNEWDREVSVNGGTLNFTLQNTNFSTGDLFVPFGIEPLIVQNTVAGFNRSDFMSVRYESSLNNFEWNVQFKPRHRGDRLVLQPNGTWLRETQPGLYTTFLFGTRYMIYNESFAFRSHGHVDQAGVRVADTTGDYLTFTQNDLLGLQFGGDAMFEMPRFKWGFRAKAGPYINWAHGSRILTTTGAADDPLMPSGSQDLNIATDGHTNKIAMVAETGIVGRYSVRPNLILQGSYDLIWLSGISLAPSLVKFEANPTNQVGASSTLLFQGLSLQAELTF
jgi:hypothetical protein